MTERVRLTLPDVHFEEVEADLREVLASGWLTNGAKVAAFEGAVATRVGTKHALATSSGTTALHLGLLALGVGPGDEVIVPDHTFPATANSVLHCGATPVLADVDLATYNLDVDDAARRVTSRTKAIMPVHQFGLPADMTRVNDLAQERGLRVIEDAACAIGASWKGRACGSLGDLACFSWHPRKVLTTGEGGMVTTNDDRYAAFVRDWRNHGMVNGPNGRTFVAPGYNFRLDELSGALGVAQMRKLDAMVKRRRELAERLRHGLRDLSWLACPSESPDAQHAWQSFVVVLREGVDRAAIVQQLAARGVEATGGAPAIHLEPYHRALARGPLPNSAVLARRSLTIPLFSRMTDEECGRVIQAMREVRP